MEEMSQTEYSIALNTIENFQVEAKEFQERQAEAAQRFSEIIKMAMGSPIWDRLSEIGQMQAAFARQLRMVLYPFATNFVYQPVQEEISTTGPIQTSFGISISVEGRFYLGNMLIHTISTNSKHGKLFKKLLLNDQNYVTDKEVSTDIGVMDKDKGIGYIKRDLKNALKSFGLSISLYRERKTGYRLMRVSNLLN